MTKIVAVVNPKACNGRVGKNWPVYAKTILARFGTVSFMHSAMPGEITTLVRRAIHEGAQRIIVVGGDGTMNEAVNGFFEHNRLINPDAALAPWPAGTGGDFARTIGLSDTDISHGYDHATERMIDVGKASFANTAGQQTSRYFLNIASLGSSAHVACKVNASSKLLGGRLSFYLGSLRGLMAYRNQPVSLNIDGRTEDMVVNTVAIANARYFGGGMMIAPNASLDDGMLDIVVIGNVGVFTFLKDAALVYKGQHLAQHYVRHFRGRTVEVTSLGNSIPMEFDGEPIGELPVRYEILPEAIRLYAPIIKAI